MIRHGSHVAPREPGKARVVWLRPDTLEVIYSGRITGEEVDDSVTQTREQLVRRPARFLIVDCGEITSYAADVRSGGVALLKVLKGCGAERAVCITPSPAVRMMASAVAFVAGLPVTFFAARADALRHLQERRSQPPPRP